MTAQHLHPYIIGFSPFGNHNIKSRVLMANSFHPALNTRAWSLAETMRANPVYNSTSQLLGHSPSKTNVLPLNFANHHVEP